MKFLQFTPLILLSLLLSCSSHSERLKSLEATGNSIKAYYAPDQRTAIFKVDFNYKKDTIIISGATDSKEAYDQLLKYMNSINVKFKNRLRLLPDSAVGNQQFAVAKNSVINIRSNPKHSAELGTQGLLGMSLKILDKKGDFYRVQTPDSYISWVDKGGIQNMNKDQFDAWNNSEKIIFTENTGIVYAMAFEKSQIISDITLGCLLQYISEDATFYKVKYPDNRIGFVHKNKSVRYSTWLKNTARTGENIEKVAKKMNGFPYLWGGTSTKGMDCSGFVKMAYLMNGFIIPRDASQQINAGKTVNVNLDFKDLEKGDLLFFGTKATDGKSRRVVHVGIWLGNKKMEFIHSSGNVHISSMDTTQPNYDEFNKNRYLGSKRYIDISDIKIIDLRTTLKL
jgi:cell wall-associated NlpC family hydrolase